MTDILQYEYELFQKYLATTDGEVSQTLEQLNNTLYTALDELLDSGWNTSLLKYIALHFIDASLYA